MSDPILDRLEALRLEREHQTALLAQAQQTVKDIKESISAIDTQAWAIVEEANNPQEALPFAESDPTDHEAAEVRATRARRRRVVLEGNVDAAVRGAGLDPSKVEWGS